MPILNLEQELVLRIVSLQKILIKSFFIVIFIFSSGLFAAVIVSDTQWEYEQKAKIIKYLIGKIVWPKGTIENDTVNVCILGQLDDPKPIESISGQKVNQLKIFVSKSPNIKKLNSRCHILYVAKSEQEQIKSIITTFSGKPVLMLGDMDNFALAGGDMNFVVTQENVALTINTEALKNADLQFDIKGYKITVVPQENDISK